MLNPRHRRYADRLRELIDEGLAVAKLERPSSFSDSIQGEDKIALHAWLTKVGNILQTVFGTQSTQYKHFQDVLPESVRSVAHSYEVHRITGVISGALDDLERGFLLGQEFIVAAEVFDTILERAKHLNEKGYKDPSAVLARVVLEDALKRIARAEGIQDNQKASILNDELKRISRYPQPRWRLVQAWLDIGNAAAHGQFDQFSDEDVTKMIDGIEQFLAMEFQT